MKTEYLPCSVKTTTTQVKSPIGTFEIEACDTGLHRIHYKGKTDKIDTLTKTDPSSPLGTTVLWIEEYFGQHNKNIRSLETPPICWAGLGKTDFEIQVWKGALDVKFGETLAYGELALAIKRPGASRAVGTALKNNPIVLLVPCHRIVRADGTFGNYSAGGNSNKEWLIKFERAN